MCLLCLRLDEHFSLVIYNFHHIWKKFSHYYFMYLFTPQTLHTFSGILIICNLSAWSFSPETLTRQYVRAIVGFISISSFVFIVLFWPELQFFKCRCLIYFFSFVVVSHERINQAPVTPYLPESIQVVPRMPVNLLISEKKCIRQLHEPQSEFSSWRQIHMKQNYDIFVWWIWMHIHEKKSKKKIPINFKCIKT